MPTCLLMRVLVFSAPACVCTYAFLCVCMHLCVRNMHRLNYINEYQKDMHAHTNICVCVLTCMFMCKYMYLDGWVGG